jgi:hypothetical protein
VAENRAASGGKPGFPDSQLPVADKQKHHFGVAPKLGGWEFFRSFIIQFAAICSALSASRPELKSGTQVAFSTALSLCVLN